VTASAPFRRTRQAREGGELAAALKADEGRVATQATPRDDVDAVARGDSRERVWAEPEVVLGRLAPGLAGEVALLEQH